MKKNIFYFLNLCYVIIALQFIANELSPLEIKNETLKEVVFNTALFATIPMLMVNFLVSRRKLLATAIPLLIVLLILILGPFKVASSATAWKTQAVLYQNVELPIMKIEYQTQDRGAYGIKQRTVKVTDIANLFMLLDKLPENLDNDPTWQKVIQVPNE